MTNLILKGVRQNNLKDIDIELPLGQSIVVTGPSGSGKSSLAFDTIYAEGQRRYMQSLSTYARQFLEKFRAPAAEKISNIPPTIALEQLNPVRNSRATVGTSTECYDYLRLLYEKAGTEYCETCNVPMKRMGYQEIFDDVVAAHADESILLTFEKTLPGDEANATEVLRDFMRSGYSRVVLRSEALTIEDLLKKGKFTGREIAVIIDRIRIPEKEKATEIQTRLTEGMRSAMSLGGGDAAVYSEREKKYFRAEEYTTLSRCPKCKKTSPPKSAISFSFNSPLGACEKCRGFGNTLELDEDLVIPNPALSISRGAIDPFTKPSLRQWQKKVRAFCETERIDMDLPWKELPADQRKKVFEGHKKWKGVRGVFKEMDEEKYKLRIRVFISRYTSPFLCTQCKGSRLAQAPLRVKVGGLSIADLCNLSVEALHEFLKTVELTKREREIAADIFRQLDRRLDYLNTVGLGYLTLSRLSRSLSGGEYQRILLATQLSQGLTDTMYVLDEPSIGLHPKDTQQLLKVLTRLREGGNSLVLVEHDPEVIEWGEHIVDMGPGSGSRGGEVVFAGSKERFFLHDSQTSRAVRDWRKDCREMLLKTQPKEYSDWLEIRGAAGNNLKSVDIEVPLNALVAITGVSGSGKSTLVVDTLYQALMKIFHGRSERIERFKSIAGFEHLSAVELVDQSPIGKSTRSNPITFMKGYDEIRSLFSQTKEAMNKGFSPGHFSFNVPGGRCETCEGEGRVKVDMVFMEDIWVPCQTCDERRFKASVLAVKYKGKGIDDVLRMTVDEAYDFFQGIPSLRAKLALLREVGLGYVQLGQPGYTMSGGEAQRLKIARELSGGGAKRTRTLFILDEPTTGLHFNEITKLIFVLRRLISAGHSVIVIEHNLQLICSADYLIDLGPDGGDHGGRVVGVGTPKELAEKKLPHTGRYLAEILEL